MARRIIIIIIVLILLGAGTWYYYTRAVSTPPAPQTLTNTLPFGNGEGSVPIQGAGSAGGSASTSTTSGGPKAHLFELSNVPTAGAVAFINKAGALSVRYMERGTGHIYDIDPVSLAKTEIINTTVPKVYNATWKPDGSTVLMQTLGADGETVVSSALTLIPPSGTSTADLYTTTSSGLPGGIVDLSSGQKNIFYTVEGLPQIVTALFDGSKAATVWSAPYTDWQLRAAGDASVVLTTKPSSSVNGYSYNLPVKSGVPQKLLGPLPGLMVLPNSTLSRVAYSFVTRNGIALEAKTLSSGAVTDIGPVTLAEKCVWAVKSVSALYCGVPIDGVSTNEPDSWYQGKTHFTDRIWRYDTDSTFSDVVADPKADFNLDIDATKLFLSPAEDYLFFINKNDLTLWALKLER